MSIDNRILAIMATPFVTIALLRILCWFAGAEWTAPGEAVVLALFITYGTGAALFICNVDLGVTRLGKKGGDA